ncbi:MAG TPA: hypothetical protein VD866_05735 [Urbifossiella sp.]|nr:hypothetical protein [Urbifossiella sp.]
MNPYELLIPQLLAGAAVVFFAFRAVRRSNRADAAHQAEYERRMTELRPASTERLTARAPTDARAVLSLALDLDDGSFPDLALVAQWAEQLVTDLGPLERDLGGRGLSLAAVRAEPGRFELLFRPDDPAGSSDRVQRMADLLNALIEERVGAAGETPVWFDRFSPGVAVAYAGVSLAA